MDRSFVAQLNDYRITTAEILYWMPDHKHVLQSFLWQNLDQAPRFPALTKFLDFWDRNLDGKLHKVTVANTQLIKPAEFRFSCGLYTLH
ncbi:usg protein [Reyranella sp.]|uniref:usg protein n=1 Tax=Reyranella sp. TaxID=1929291 RepID=UPI003BAC40EE